MLRLLSRTGVSPNPLLVERFRAEPSRDCAIHSMVAVLSSGPVIVVTCTVPGCTTAPGYAGYRDVVS